MGLGLLGRKNGMTQLFNEEGACVPVTVLRVGPCTVLAQKNTKKNGYNAIQLGFAPQKPQRMNKPQKAIAMSHLKEFRVANPDDFQVGQVMTVAGFKPGDSVDVWGLTKGRGFQGVMKKEGKHGGPDAHGSGFHRRPGSIGMRTWPGRVLKNMGMPGRMGNEAVRIRNLKVVAVNTEENLLIVKGAIPGARKGLVIIFNREKDFETRFKPVAPSPPLAQA